MELGNSMRYEVEREGTLTPRVGYTYFGQFIGHDLTHDPTPLAGPYPEPERTPNYRTPSFDLDHVYGGGPDKSPHLYEGTARAMPEVPQEHRATPQFGLGARRGAGYSIQ